MTTSSRLRGEASHPLVFVCPPSSYDPFQNCWKQLADMLEFRSSFCTVARGDRLYALGGDKEINTNVDSVEMYNLETDSWRYDGTRELTLIAFLFPVG